MFLGWEVLDSFLFLLLFPFFLGKTGRFNANGMDLDRDFPKWYESKASIIARSGFEPETLALMSWSLNQPAVLSANLQVTLNLTLTLTLSARHTFYVAVIHAYI